MAVPEETAMYLRYSIYNLYYVGDVKTVVFAKEDVARIKSCYSADIWGQIMAALRWAADHPNADLSGILPEIPHSNNAIHSYLRNLLKAFTTHGEEEPT